MKGKPNPNVIKVPQFNFNSILMLVLSLLVTFVWNSVVKLNENVAKLQAAQESTSNTLKELMPKPEIMLRFGVVEKDLIELRLRVQTIELELAKGKKTK